MSERQDAGNESRLEALVTKWRTVGREVAWLVWDTVKDLDPGEGLKGTATRNAWEGDAVLDRNGKKSGLGSGGFQAGWGYDNGKADPKSGGFDGGWGWDDRKDDESNGEDGRMDDTMDVDWEGRQVQNHSLGTMLRHLGIDPDTLGWDEDEGDFEGAA